jgi:hypothetical protein
MFVSQWFNQLPDADKAKVQDVVKLATRQSVFGVFAVLDGVRQVDGSENKGVLELRYCKNGQSQLINDSNTQPLHDIFNQIVPPA